MPKKRKKAAMAIKAAMAAETGKPVTSMIAANTAKAEKAATAIKAAKAAIKRKTKGKRGQRD